MGTDTYSYGNPNPGPGTTLEYGNLCPYNALSVDGGSGFRFGQRLAAVWDILFNSPVTGNYHNIDSALALGLR